MAPRTKPCPECGDPIASYRKSCECGWSADVASFPKQRHMCECAKCSARLVYPSLKETKPRENYIIGRSIVGGYICRDCYQAGETYAANFRRDEWLERHRNDYWGAAYSASREVRSKEDISDLVGILKKTMGSIGKLPYNPATIEPERDAYGQ